MEKSTDAASGSDKETQTASASVRTIDGPETKKPSENNTTSAEKLEAGTGDQDASESTSAETPRSPAKVFGYVRGLVAWVAWMPKNCRYDPEGPPKFNLALNLLFALVSSHLIVWDTHVVFYHHVAAV